jgi:hypothetical protein
MNAWLKGILAVLVAVVPGGLLAMLVFAGLRALWRMWAKEEAGRVSAVDPAEAQNPTDLRLAL